MPIVTSLRSDANQGVLAPTPKNGADDRGGTTVFTNRNVRHIESDRSSMHPTESHNEMHVCECLLWPVAMAAATKVPLVRVPPSHTCNGLPCIQGERARPMQPAETRALICKGARVQAQNSGEHRCMQQQWHALGPPDPMCTLCITSATIRGIALLSMRVGNLRCYATMCSYAMLTRSCKVHPTAGVKRAQPARTGYRYRI